MSSIDNQDTDPVALLTDVALADLQLRQQPFTTEPIGGESFMDPIAEAQLDDIKQALITGKLMTALATNSAFAEISDFAFITGLLSAIEVMLGMPIDDIMKTMPLAKPIEKALVEESGLLGELLHLTTNYITVKGDNIQKMIEPYSLSP